MDLNELDLNEIGDWPVTAKAVVIALLCGLVGFGWYHFVTSGQIDQLERAEQKEQELRQGFERKQHKAANLEAYRRQLAMMEESFGAMLRQLPDQTEVASLLVDVSQTGLAAGLEFERFEPAAEITRDFYAELPIRVRVTGRYHEFARFISGLAALPRIVTVHDIEIRRGDDPGDASTQGT
ncbi:MAG: type 4a pilus biogenesis protein PilO, partial [Gammaproteobacteria bacterium]|nr:type 4a pilus biogenesis protein PilO [Gammaproteobacteria bacterium]